MEGWRGDELGKGWRVGEVMNWVRDGGLEIVVIWKYGEVVILHLLMSLWS